MEPSWTEYEPHAIASEIMYDYNPSEDEDANLLSDEDHEENNNVCINCILPDDLVAHVLALLPVADIVTAGCVCKKWYELVHSWEFLKVASVVKSPKSWYFIFTYFDKPFGHIYDPDCEKWQRFELPYVEITTYPIASFSGLLCFTPSHSIRDLHVCNPITKKYRKLEDPRGSDCPDYSALAISVSRVSHSYTVAMVRSTKDRTEGMVWDVEIDVFSSEKLAWEPSLKLVAQEWRGGCDSAICDGVLYFAVYTWRPVPIAHGQSGLLAYRLGSQSLACDMREDFIPAPFRLSCMRLISLKDELVMVGAIEIAGRGGMIEGVGVWVLRRRQWVEISRMPGRFLRRFRPYEDLFHSSGFGELIYIQGYDSRRLLVFNVETKQWKWSRSFPANRRKCPLEVYGGTCFEPRLDIAP
ncbi:hypothetical protein Nepgr_011197 [Nepenthes gracilis]|uniref:F-box domain-containing protein n=1 Tax=Nepenthes gracilis TaxID=150966 RepID=A0AAD3SER1_NEPGR|nr:hypothetical protein Nepgr_011197 [Nepenthes gracilis]